MPFNLAVPGAVIRADHYNENLSRTVATDDPRTIIVPHVFNPSVPGAPFVLGVNARGQLVTGLNADMLDGQHASAFAPASHKSQHATGGADPLAPADIGAVATTRQVLAGTGLTGGGDLSADRTLAIDTAVVPRKNAQETISSPWRFTATDAAISLSAGYLLTRGGDGIFDGSSWHSTALVMAGLKYVGTMDPKDNSVYLKDVGSSQYGGAMLMLRANGGIAQRGFYFYLAPNSTGAGTTAVTTEVLRITETAFTYLGGKVWHEGNDGPGSGLDADLLDGQHASAFLLKAGDTMSGQLTISVKGDGAELLRLATDRPWSFYQRGTDAGANLELRSRYSSKEFIIAGSDGAVLASFFCTTEEGGNKVKLVPAGGLVEIGGLTMFSMTPKVGTSDIWHQGNDGSGSGLDADLLDGQHASAFAAASHTHSAADIISGTLGVARGGTGLASYAAGDLIYATGSTTLARRAIGSTNQVLAVVSGAPAWQTPSGGGQVVGTGRQILTGTGLQGGGDLSANRTLSVKPADFVTISTSPPSGTPAAGVGALWAQVS